MPCTTQWVANSSLPICVETDSRNVNVVVRPCYGHLLQQKKGVWRRPRTTRTSCCYHVCTVPFACLIISVRVSLTYRVVIIDTSITNKMTRTIRMILLQVNIPFRNATCSNSPMTMLSGPVTYDTPSASLMARLGTPIPARTCRSNAVQFFELSSARAAMQRCSVMPQVCSQPGKRRHDSFCLARKQSINNQLTSPLYEYCQRGVLPKLLFFVSIRNAVHAHSPCALNSRKNYTIRMLQCEHDFIYFLARKPIAIKRLS